MCLIKYARLACANGPFHFAAYMYSLERAAAAAVAAAYCTVFSRARQLAISRRAYEKSSTTIYYTCIHVDETLQNTQTVVSSEQLLVYFVCVALHFVSC